MSDDVIVGHFPPFSTVNPYLAAYLDTHGHSYTISVTSENYARMHFDRTPDLTRLVDEWEGARTVSIDPRVYPGACKRVFFAIRSAKLAAAG